jgi:hypothetical protein
MKKQLINSFTDKYSLNGLIESVKWSVVSADNQIKTSSTSDDKNILAFVTLKDAAKLSDIEFGVNDTAKLKKMLGVLGDEVEIVPNTTNDKITSITLTSEGTEVQYVTADLSVIPPVPTLKKIPVFNLEIPLTKEFVSTFVKAKSALADVDILTLTKDKNGKIKMILGFSNTNSNRINLDIKTVEGKDSLGKTIHYNAKYLKEILVANKDANSAKLQISTQGLAHIAFKIDDYTSKYYLVEVQLSA